jgi:hypothetical protein
MLYQALMMDTEILNLSRKFHLLHPEGAIFIGGVAIDAHMSALNIQSFAPRHTLDIDIYLSDDDFIALRDVEYLTPSRRSSKFQLIKDGVPIDIYPATASQAPLIVPFTEMAAAAVIADGLRVAGIEHLLTLKAEALIRRAGTGKTDQDRLDTVRLLYAAGQSSQGLSLTHLDRMTEIHRSEIHEVMKSTDLYLLLVQGDLDLATHIRRTVHAVWPL